MAGGAARAVAAAATCPITIVKTRMEMTGASAPYAVPARDPAASHHTIARYHCITGLCKLSFLCVIASPHASPWARSCLPHACLALHDCVALLERVCGVYKREHR